MTEIVKNKFLDIPNKLKVDGFNPNQFAEKLEDTGEYFLPYAIQMWWFQQVYPNGRIICSEPLGDSDGAGVFFSTVEVFTDSEVPSFKVSTRAIYDNLGMIDPYLECQRKAISVALRGLGFWLTPIIKPIELSIPVEQSEQNENLDIIDTSNIVKEEIKTPVVSVPQKNKKAKSDEKSISKDIVSDEEQLTIDDFVKDNKEEVSGDDIVITEVHGNKKLLGKTISEIAEMARASKLGSKKAIDASALSFFTWLITMNDSIPVKAEMRDLITAAKRIQAEKAVL